MKRHRRRNLAFFTALLCGLLFACSTDTRNDTPTMDLGPIAECEAYVAAYSACFGSVGPMARKATDERVASLRATFKAEAKDETSREQLRSTCASAAQRMAGCR